MLCFKCNYKKKNKKTVNFIKTTRLLLLWCMHCAGPGIIDIPPIQLSICLQLYG